MVHGIPAKFIVKEDIYSWPPRTQGGDPVLIADKTMPRDSGLEDESSRRYQDETRAAKWRMAHFQMHQRITLVVAAPLSTPYKPDRQQKCKTVFHFSPSSQNGRVSSGGRSILPVHRRLDSLLELLSKIDNFVVKVEPRSSRHVPDKVDAVLEKLEQDRHISSYDVTEDLEIDYKTVLTHLKKHEFTKKLDAWVPRVY
ncbi:hypothetical protein EVAR_64019_1 [Eumeta japonica]|uniref:Histone-lysine N-methyltransferase SETMAR n=1 Tax=Eumeta variegata TaxID=151549 RepID=A0A4C1Z2K1_EUMVA|nr:hypothetical protein EVAR_64019_1 [Eumeta japonica]